MSHTLRSLDAEWAPADPNQPRHGHQTPMTLGLTAGAGVRPRAWRSRGPSHHADT
jgi:hypothetical protein